jgi:uncharacterized membrane protein (Fun14 family)
MSEPTPIPQAERPSVARRFFGDMWNMPRWQKTLLGLFLGLGAAGGAGQVYSRLTPPPSRAQVQNETAINTPPPGKSFVGGSPQSPDTPTPPPADTPQPEPSWLTEHSPWLTRTGLSFVAAFIIGWAFRVFIKTMAFITAFGAGVMLLLSHFRVINIDFSAAEQHYATAAAWLSDQAGHLKDAAIAHLPASTSGAFGLFVGFRKK